MVLLAIFSPFAGGKAATPMSTCQMCPYWCMGKHFGTFLCTKLGLQPCSQATLCKTSQLESCCLYAALLTKSSRAKMICLSCSHSRPQATGCHFFVFLLSLFLCWQNAQHCNNATHQQKGSGGQQPRDRVQPLAHFDFIQANVQKITFMQNGCVQASCVGSAHTMHREHISR